MPLVLILGLVLLVKTLLTDKEVLVTVNKELSILELTTVPNVTTNVKLAQDLLLVALLVLMLTEISI